MINYVDYDYWDYGYAYGDIRYVDGVADISAYADVSAQSIRIRTSEGFIDCNASIYALGNATYSGVASVLGEASLTATAYRDRYAQATIDATATVDVSGTRIRTSSGYIVCNAEVVANAVAIYSANGSIVGYASATADGHVLGEGWVETAVSPNVWTRKDNLLYVELDYVLAGYIDATANYWTQSATSSNTWRTQG